MKDGYFDIAKAYILYRERLSKIMDLKKEKNFFEARVTEYKTGGQLEWD